MLELGLTTMVKSYAKVILSILMAAGSLCLSACGSSVGSVSGADDVALDDSVASQEEEVTTSEEIAMPQGSSDYLGSEWTAETLTEHFQELGFNNIHTVPCEPDDDDHKTSIMELSIEKGLFSSGQWEGGERFSPDTEISIYYNESPLLTVDNCSDFTEILSGEDADYASFANEYDGRYVEFDAYVVSHITYDGDTSHIIDVASGDYDGVSGLGVMAVEDIDGAVVRVGDRSLDADIDESVKEGQSVAVSGKIDASWSEYYEQLYVEGLTLNKR